jgi:hypothetical protein
MAAFTPEILEGPACPWSPKILSHPPTVPMSKPEPGLELDLRRPEARLRGFRQQCPQRSARSVSAQRPPQPVMCP